MALPTASDNKFPKIIIRESTDDGSDFSNPDADYRVLFLGEDGELHLMDSAGTVTDVSSGGNALSSTVVRRTTAQSVGGSGTETAISFDTETEDIDGCWAIGTPTKLVIPAGLNGRRARVYGGAIFAANTTGNYRQLRIARAAAALTPDAVFIIPDLATNVTSTAIQVESHVLTLATGDEFTLLMRIDATGFGIESGYFGLYTVD